MGCRTYPPPSPPHPLTSALHVPPPPHPPHPAPHPLIFGSRSQCSATTSRPPADGDRWTRRRPAGGRGSPPPHRLPAMAAAFIGRPHPSSRRRVSGASATVPTPAAPSPPRHYRRLSFPLRPPHRLRRPTTVGATNNSTEYAPPVWGPPQVRTPPEQRRGRSTVYFTWRDHCERRWAGARCRPSDRRRWVQLAP